MDVALKSLKNLNFMHYYSLPVKLQIGRKTVEIVNKTKCEIFSTNHMNTL